MGERRFNPRAVRTPRLRRRTHVDILLDHLGRQRELSRVDKLVLNRLAEKEVDLRVARQVAGLERLDGLKTEQEAEQQ